MTARTFEILPLAARFIILYSELHFKMDRSAREREAKLFCLHSAFFSGTEVLLFQISSTLSMTPAKVFWISRRSRSPGIRASSSVLKYACSKEKCRLRFVAEAALIKQLYLTLRQR